MRLGTTTKFRDTWGNCRGIQKLNDDQKDKTGN